MIRPRLLGVSLGEKTVNTRSGTMCAVHMDIVRRCNTIKCPTYQMIRLYYTVAHIVGIFCFTQIC